MDRSFLVAASRATMALKTPGSHASPTATQHLLEEQSIPHPEIHRRKRFAPSAVGRDRSRTDRRRSKASGSTGPPVRDALRRSILDREWKIPFRCPLKASGRLFYKGAVTAARAARTLRLGSSPVPCVTPHLDDGIVQHLRRHTDPPIPQLRRLCDQGTLRRDHDCRR